MRVSLDTNVWIFGIVGDDHFCETILVNLSKFDVIVPNQVRLELERNLSEKELKKFYYFINEFDVTADYTLLSFDVRLCQIWGELRAARLSMGKPISSQDAWIAATALHYDISPVTHNPKDFVDISNLRIITTVE